MPRPVTPSTRPLSAAGRHGVAVRTARERQAKADLLALVQAILADLYPGGTVPPLEGGRVFRDISDVTGCPEAAIAACATVLGYWRSHPADIDQAIRRRERVRHGERDAVIAELDRLLNEE